MPTTIYSTQIQEIQSWIILNEKIRPDIVKRNHPIIYDMILSITSLLPITASLRQRYFHILNPTHNIHCPICGTVVKWNEDKRNYRSYCSTKCMSNSNNVREKTKHTNLEKYNGVAPACNINIVGKMKTTKLVKYGDENYTNREQSKQTCLFKYGVDNPTKNIDIVNKVKISSIQTHLINGVSIREQTKQTNLDRYGAENPQQNKEIREKTKQTNLERYGFTNALNNIDVQTRQKQTNLTKYSVEHHRQKHMINILPLIEDYGWLFNQYITIGKTATQIAVDLGCVSYTTIISYLKRAEIDIRYNYGYSYACINWLNNIIEQEGIDIKHALNGGEYQIPGTRYKADGYCVETNTVYEFHGDYWHGNPKIYTPEIINEVNGKTMGELYLNTTNKEKYIKELGYTLIVMWENDLLSKNNRL